MDCNSQPCLLIQQDILRHVSNLQTRRCYSFSGSFLSCKCFEANKTFLATVNRQAAFLRKIRAYLHHWARTGFWISGHCCQCLAACSSSSSNFIGPFQKVGRRVAGIKYQQAEMTQETVNAENLEFQTQYDCHILLMLTQLCMEHCFPFSKLVCIPYFPVASKPPKSLHVAV